MKKRLANLQTRQKNLQNRQENLKTWQENLQTRKFSGNFNVHVIVFAEFEVLPTLKQKKSTLPSEQRSRVTMIGRIFYK